MADASRSPARLIVGISGASGVIYGVRLLEALRPLRVETHLVMTRTAEVTLAHETDWKVSDVRRLADVAYRIDDLAAAVSSGSYRTMGMVVAPCSMRSLSEIAHGRIVFGEKALAEQSDGRHEDQSAHAWSAGLDLMGFRALGANLFPRPQANKAVDQIGNRGDLRDHGGREKRCAPY